MIHAKQTYFILLTDMKSVLYTCLPSKKLPKLLTYVMSPQWQCSACIYTADR